MPYSTETTVRELLDNPTTASILEKFLPGFSAHPQVAMAGGMSLAIVAKFSNGLITDDALEKIDGALKALG